MADRAVNLKVDVDTSGLKRLEDQLGSVAAKLRQVDSQFRSLGSGASLAGLRNSGAPAAAQGGARQLLGASGQVFGSSSAEIVNQLRMQTNQLNQIIGLLRGGGARVAGAGGGRPGGGREVEGRITDFIKGGMVSQLGHSIGAFSQDAPTGAAIAGIGGVVQGAAAGGLPGALLAATTGLINFGKALNDEAKATYERGHRRREFDRGQTIASNEQQGRHRAMDIQEGAIFGNRDQSDVQQDLIGNRLRTLRNNREVLQQSQGEAMSRVMGPRGIHLSGDEREQLRQSSVTAQKAINDSIEEERKLRMELLQVKAQDVAATEKLANTTLNSLNKQKAALYELLDAEKKSAKAEFGRLNEYDQDRYKRVNKAFRQGEQLAPGDVDFARQFSAFGEDVQKHDMAKADRAGYEGDEELRGRVEGRARQIEGQIRTLEENINVAMQTKVEVEIDKKSIEDAFKNAGDKFYSEVKKSSEDMKKTLEGAGSAAIGAMMAGAVTRRQAGG